MSAPGLYLHVPFCARACPYCDFDFEVGRVPRLEPYLHRLADEVAHHEHPRRPQAFDTLYWGGGTPSILGPSGAVAVFERLGPLLAGDGALREFTVECNPEHVDASLLATLQSLGVTRISLGVQSLQAPALEMLGRVHRGAQARAAIDLVKHVGLEVSVDLIVGWPGQGPDILRADLGQLVQAEVDHVSTYALTIEENTPWIGLMRRGKRSDVDADAQAERLNEVEAYLCSNGFEHYEISSYARAGRRAVHNQKYWNGIDYLGLGPSAASASFGELARGGPVVRTQNPRGLAAWIARRDPVQERLAGSQALGEALWLGLRQLEGMVPAELADRCGVTEQVVLQRLARSLERGLVERDGDRVRLAAGAWLVADSVAVEVISQPES